MKLLVIVWLIGIALVLDVLIAPALRSVLLVGSAVYFVTVAIWCVATASRVASTSDADSSGIRTTFFVPLTQA